MLSHPPFQEREQWGCVTSPPTPGKLRQGQCSCPPGWPPPRTRTVQGGTHTFHTPHPAPKGKLRHSQDTVGRCGQSSSCSSGGGGSQQAAGVTSSSWYSQRLGSVADVTAVSVPQISVTWGGTHPGVMGTPPRRGWGHSPLTHTGGYGARQGIGTLLPPPGDTPRDGDIPPHPPKGHPKDTPGDEGTGTWIPLGRRRGGDGDTPKGPVTPPPGDKVGGHPGLMGTWNSPGAGDTPKGHGDPFGWGGWQGM